MKYTIIISKQVQKFLKSPHDLSLQFTKKIALMQKNPFHPTLDITHMRWEAPNIYRLSIGKYRFLYEIERQQIIFFLRAWNRGDIYK